MNEHKIIIEQFSTNISFLHCYILFFNSNSKHNSCFLLAHQIKCRKNANITHKTMCFLNHTIEKCNNWETTKWFRFFSIVNEFNRFLTVAISQVTFIICKKKRRRPFLCFKSIYYRNYKKDNIVHYSTDLQVSNVLTARSILIFF